MKDVQKLDMRKTGEWLSEEVEFRLPKLWLAIGGAAAALLLLAALD